MEDDLDLFGLDVGSTNSTAQAPAAARKGAGTGGMKFDDILAVESDLSPDEFVRAAYINLAKSSFTADVLDCVFDPVENGIMQMVGCEAHVDTSYKYDRVEYATANVMGEETRHDSRHRSYTVKVPQTIQIPQYIPETGAYSEDVEGFVFNLRDFSAVDNPASYLFYMDCNIPDIRNAKKQRPQSGMENVILADAAYMRATSRCCDIANSNAPLPNEYDHITFTPTYYVRKVSCYMVPYYSTAYKLGGRSYKAKGFACGSAKVWQECPPGGIGKESLEARGEKETHVKGVKWGFPIATWVLYVLAIILSAAVGVNCFWTFVLPLAAYLAGLIAYKICANRCNSYASRLNVSWPSMMCSKLNSVFAAHGFRPLTSTEQNEFKRVDFTGEKRKSHSMSDISLYAAIVLIIFVITLFAVIFAAAKILG